MVYFFLCALLGTAGWTHAFAQTDSGFKPQVLLPPSSDLKGTPPEAAAPPSAQTPGKTFAPQTETQKAVDKRNSAPMGGLPQIPGLGGAGSGGPGFVPSNASPSGGGGYSGPAGYHQAVGQTAFVGDKLSCKRDGIEKCNGVELKLQAAANFDGNRQRFIDWIKPAALYVQAQTGLPASIIIAMAAHETGWGTSANFRERNSMFGHSCWNNATQTGQVQLGNKVMSYTGHCNANRPANEGGKYLSFPNREESLLAYLQNILMSKGRYQGVQKEVRRASTGEAPGVGHWKTVLADIVKSGYAADGGYFMKVGSIIAQHDLEVLDRGDECQICVHQLRRGGAGNSGGSDAIM